jgi:hypothetical protein
MLLRYGLGGIFSRAGMRDALALPLGLYFILSGHARRSRVTARAFFSFERACETFSRYRLAFILSRADMRDALALPLGLYFFPSGHARRSCVTAWLLFYLERVCETFSRYLSSLFSFSSGTLDTPALPFFSLFS